MSTQDSTIGSFISMMEHFLDELSSTFPKETKVKVYLSSFNMLKKTNPRKILDVFMQTIGPYTEQVMNKDESIMLDESIPLNKELNLKAIWTNSETTENTKDAIWAHLNTLLMFGTTIQNIPSGLMQGIEKLAQDYSSQMDENSLDPTMLLSGMQHMFSAMNLPQN